MALKRSGVRIPSGPPLSSMFYIYVLQSTTSGRYYVGTTKDVAQRME
ncbi:MAG: hypothetical protein EXR49_03130 [Dehalococcoidia bacterium]|nr:hypothetical protein [Dehalococcoidia bacterium]